MLQIWLFSNIFCMFIVVVQLFLVDTDELKVKFLDNQQLTRESMDLATDNEKPHTTSKINSTDFHSETRFSYGTLKEERSIKTDTRLHRLKGFYFVNLLYIVVYKSSLNYLLIAEFTNQEYADMHTYILYVLEA